MLAGTIKRRRPVNSLRLIRSERIERATYLNRKEAKKLDFILKQLERENHRLATTTHRKKKHITLQLLQLYRSTGHSTEAIPLQQEDSFVSDSILSTKRFDDWRRQERELESFLARSKIPSQSFYKLEDTDYKSVPCVLNLKASDYDFAIPDWFEEKCLTPPNKQIDVFSCLRHDELVKNLRDNSSKNCMTTFPGNQWNKSTIEEYKRRVVAANTRHIHHLYLEENRQTKPLSAADILKSRQESKLTSVTNPKSTDCKYQINSRARIQRVKTSKPSTRSSNKSTRKRSKTAPAGRIKKTTASDITVRLRGDHDRPQEQEEGRIPSAQHDQMRQRSNLSTVSITKLETTKEKELLQFLMKSFRQATSHPHPPDFSHSKDLGTPGNNNLIRTRSSEVAKLMLNSLKDATFQNHEPGIQLSSDPITKVTKSKIEKPDTSQVLLKSMNYYLRSRSSLSSMSCESTNEHDIPSPMQLDVDKNDQLDAPEMLADIKEDGDEYSESNLTLQSFQCNQSPHPMTDQENRFPNKSETSKRHEDGKVKKDELVSLPKPVDDASSSQCQTDSQLSNSSQHVSNTKERGKLARDLNRRNIFKSAESQKNYHVTGEQHNDVSPRSAHSRRLGTPDTIVRKERKKCVTKLLSHHTPISVRSNISESCLNQKTSKKHDSSEMLKTFSHATSLHVRRNPRPFSQTELLQSRPTGQQAASSELYLRDNEFENEDDSTFSGWTSDTSYCTNPYPVTPKREEPRDRAFMTSIMGGRHLYSERDFLSSKNKMKHRQKDLAHKAPLDSATTSISNVRKKGVQSSLFRQKRLESLVSANKDSHERLMDEVRKQTNIELSAVMTFAKLQSSNLFKRQSAARSQNCVVKLND